MRHKKTIRWLVGFLLLLHLAALLAGFLAPYSPTTQEREFPYAAPTRIHFVDGSGHFHLRPFVYGVEPSSSDSQISADQLANVHSLRFMVPGERYPVAGWWKSNLHLFGVDAPGKLFLLGTDGYGRDQFSRLWFGSQISLVTPLVATVISLGMGVTLGAMAGFWGGWVDELIMRIAELFVAIPWLYLLFAVRAALPLSISPVGAFLLLVTVIGTVGWARPARLIRSVVLTTRQQDFVLAARAAGATSGSILWQHILPQTWGVVVTQAAILIPQYLLAEVTLSFLGIGVPEPTPSWGNMAGSVQQYSILTSYWWMLIPVIVIIPVMYVYDRLAAALHEPVKSSA